MRKMLRTTRGERADSRTPSDLESSVGRETQISFKIPTKLEQNKDQEE